MYYDGVDEYDAMIWRQYLAHSLSEAAMVEIRRTRETTPFVDQLKHMLKLAGLSIREWDLLSGFVRVFMNERDQEMIKKMVYAYRYQGFDPSVIIRKMIAVWRAASLVPKETMAITAEDGSQCILIKRNS